MVFGHETGHISRTDGIASTGFWSGKPARNLRGHAMRPSIPLVEKSRWKRPTDCFNRNGENKTTRTEGGRGETTAKVKEEEL